MTGFDKDAIVNQSDIELINMMKNPNESIPEALEIAQSELQRRKVPFPVFVKCTECGKSYLESENKKSALLHYCDKCILKLRMADSIKLPKKFTDYPKLAGGIGAGLGIIFGLAYLPTSIGAIAYSIQGGKYAAFGCMLGDPVGWLIEFLVSKFQK